MTQTSKHFVFAHFFTIGIGFINTVSWRDQYFKLVPVDDKSELAFGLLHITNDRSTIGCIKQCALFDECDVVAVPNLRNQSDCICLVSLKLSPTTIEGAWFYSDSWKIYAKEGASVQVMVLRASERSEDAVLAKWIENNTFNKVDLKEALGVNKNLSQTYKNGLLDTWEKWDIQTVQVAMLSRGAENFRIVFDGKGTDRLSWFSTSRRLSSPWPDLNGHTGDPYSINYMPDKTFAIKQFAIGCMMSGWMVVVEEGNTCTWSTDPFSYPQFLYSPSSSHAAFDVSGDRMLADDFVIYLNIKLA